jgi:hypothetical protein
MILKKVIKGFVFFNESNKNTLDKFELKKKIVLLISEIISNVTSFFC